MPPPAFFTELGEEPIAAAWSAAGELAEPAWGPVATAMPQVLIGMLVADQSCRWWMRYG